jgi:hypothetical protein
MPLYGNSVTLDVPCANLQEAFTLIFTPSNLARGKKMKASSESATGAPCLAADGGVGSRWESDYLDTQWIYVDLGKPEKVQKVILKWENAYAKHYEIQVSNDAEKWKTVSEVEDGNGNTDEIIFEPIEVRYVRMNGLRRATECGYSIFEFAVYGADRKEDAFTQLHFVSLELEEADGRLIAENCYGRNGINDLDYRDLNRLPEADLSISVTDNIGNKMDGLGVIHLKIKNNSPTVAFGNRLRLVDRMTGQRILPVSMDDN